MRITVSHGIGRAAAVAAAAIVLVLGVTTTGAGAAPGDNGNAANTPAATQAKAHDNGSARSEHAKAKSSQGKPAAEDTNSPQPPSNADYSGNGANTHGPYDSTRDGSPSQNGNGDGKAIGKPCAGCVGKADNKNPPGQQPGGSDPNAGYECDTNHGVGKTNPAHTSCKQAPPTTTPPPPTTTPPDKTPPPEKTPPDTSTPPAPTPPGETTPPAGGPAPEAAPEVLPTTGVNVALPLLGGLAALLAGGILFAVSRRWASNR